MGDPLIENTGAGAIGNKTQLEKVSSMSISRRKKAANRAGGSAPQTPNDRCREGISPADGHYRSVGFHAAQIAKEILAPL